MEEEMNEQQNEKAWNMFSLLTQKQQDYIVEKVRMERERQEEEWFNNLPEKRQEQLLDAWFDMVREDYLYETFIHDLSLCGKANMMELVLDVADEDHFWIEEYEKYGQLD
jgi:hypothetical protein